MRMRLDRGGLDDSTDERDKHTARYVPPRPHLGLARALRAPVYTCPHGRRFARTPGVICTHM